MVRNTSSIERWPQTPTFSQVVGLVRETYEPSDSIRSTIETYLPKAIEIFCAKCFRDSKENTQSSEVPQVILWRGKKLEPKEPELLKAKQLSEVLGTSESFAVLLIREYVSTVHLKSSDSITNITLLDLIKFFYVDEQAAYSFLAQILDICQDQEHPLHSLCMEVWNRAVENESFQLEPKDASRYSFADLGLQMLKRILENEGILVGWKQSSPTSKYDNLVEEVLELESYRLLWTLELLFSYHYSHVCSPFQLIDFVHLMWRMTVIMEPSRTWHWKCYLTFYGLLIEVLCLEEWTDNQVGISSDEQQFEKMSKSFNDVDFNELYNQMEALLSSRKYLGAISVAELSWSAFLHVTSHKKWQNPLTEQQQQLWSSCARMHFSQAVSNGAIEELDRTLCNTPFVNPYSLQETRGKLNGIFFGFLETLFLSFIPRQLNLSERMILNRLFVNTMKNTVPVIQRIWWIYEEPTHWKYNGYLCLLLYNLSLFPLDMQPSCQLLSGLIGNEWSAYRLYQYIESELPFYTSVVDPNKLGSIQFLSLEQFRLECNVEGDWLLSEWAALGVPIAWNGYLMTKDGQRSRNCIGFYIESESKVVWRMQWNGWKYISYYFQQMLTAIDLKDSWQYNEFIALLEMIHRLIYNGNSSCIDGILSYIHEDVWIGLYRRFMESFLRAEFYTFTDSNTQELKRKQYYILQSILDCMNSFIISSPTTRWITLLSEHIEEWYAWFPMLAKYSRILSSMIQIWTCLLHMKLDVLDDNKKNRIFSQALYLLRTKRPIGNRLLWETCDDMFLYTSCILCLSYAPLEMLFPTDWIKSLEHFCNIWLSRRHEGSSAWFSSLERNTLDWRWFDRQNEEQRIQQSYSLLGYSLIHFIYKQNDSMNSNDCLRRWWITLSHSRYLIRVLAFLAFNAQQFALVHEQILKFILLDLEWNDSNWPKFCQFLFSEHVGSSRSSSYMIASRCLIQLFQGLCSDLFHQDYSKPQVLWPEDEEETNILVNSFLFNIVSSNVCLSTLSTFVVCNGWRSDQRGLSRSLISLPKSTSHQIEDFLKSKNMDFEWLSTCVDLLSSLKHRLLDNSACLERGDGIRFLSLVSLLKEAWLSFGSLWLQDVWEKFGVWKLLLSFVNKKRENIFAWLCRHIKEEEDDFYKDYLDDITGWLEGVAIVLEWLALEIFDCFRFSNEDENTTSLWSLTCEELDLDGLECFWTKTIENWFQSFHTSDGKESIPHVYSIMSHYKNWLDVWKKEKNCKDLMPCLYYETISIIPGEYFYEIRYHPNIHKYCQKDVDWLQRMHQQTSRFQAIEKCIYSLYRLYFTTMAVSKQKNRFYSFWSFMWNKILEYMSGVPFLMTCKLDGILAQWLLDMAHQSKLNNEIYPLKSRHIMLLDKTWKQSKNVFSYFDMCQTGNRAFDLFHVWKQPLEKVNHQWLRMHLLFSFSKVVSRQGRFVSLFSLSSEQDKYESSTQQENRNTLLLLQVIVQVLQDVMQEEESVSVDSNAVCIHAWSFLLCSLPLEFLQTLHPNMLKEWSHRILSLWKRWMSLESTSCEERNKITLLLSNRWSMVDQILLMHIKLWLAIPESSNYIHWKENFLQECVSYASLDMFPREMPHFTIGQRVPSIQTFYDTWLQQRQPWHRYWIHRLSALSLHYFFFSSNKNSSQLVLQWISTHVSLIEESLYLFPRHLGDKSIEESPPPIENPQGYWNFARMEEMEQLCTLLHSLYSDSPSLLFQNYLPEIYHQLLVCLYRCLYQVYRFIQTGVWIECWIKPMTTSEHELYNTSPIDKQQNISSPNMKSKSFSSEEESAGVHLPFGSSPPFPSTPQASSPVFWKRRLELSPKKLALTQSSPEKKKGYKTKFGQRVLYSLMRSFMLSIRCWKYALLRDWENTELEAGLFLSSQRPSLGIFLAIPIMLVPYSYSISLSRDDLMSWYLDNILNDCFLIVCIFGQRYEQQQQQQQLSSSQVNVQPWKLKEDIAKRWFPLMETIQQRCSKIDSGCWFGWKCVEEWLQK